MEREGLRNSKIEGGLRTRDSFHKKSEPGKPLISIITVVRNGEKYLEQTIQSVLNQTYENIEYIIIDGVSTDGTLDIIRKYEDRIAYWMSEPDGGIYDAMNKGIEFSSGEIIGIINSDDWYNSDTVKKVTDAFSLYKDVGLVHGKLSCYELNGKFIKHVSHSDSFPKRLLSTPFKHPTCFYKKFIYDQIGVFDISFKLAADYDLMLRTIKAGVKRHYIDHPLANLRKVGVTTSSNDVSAPEEIKIVLQGHTSSLAVASFFVFLRKLQSSLSAIIRHR